MNSVERHARRVRDKLPADGEPTKLVYASARTARKAATAMRTTHPDVTATVRGRAVVYHLTDPPA